MANVISQIAHYILLVIEMLKSIAKKAQDALIKNIHGKEITSVAESLYDIVDEDMDGNEVSMKSFENNVLLVVNVASKWGLTKQNYTELPQLIDEYGPRGLKVLAFPCNQFGGQEPGTHEEILKFVDKFFPHEKVTWFAKGDVNGAGTREAFSFLKRELPAEDGSSNIRWNFAKFLIDHEGKPFKRYSPTAPPVSLKDDIETLLKRKESFWMLKYLMSA